MGDTLVVTGFCRERIICQFPVTDSAGELAWSFVVTTDDEPKPEFTLWQIDPDGSVMNGDDGHYHAVVYLTLPRAIREARKACGWG